MVSITLVISFIFITGSSLIAKASEPTGAGFYVQTILPENQKDTSKSYFDLLVEPSWSQALEVLVTNTDSVPITIDVTLGNAHTTEEGSVDYKPPDVRDESLELAFIDVASTTNNKITLQPQEEKLVKVDLNFPEKPFQGEMLGGIVFERKPDSDTGEMIINSYSYIIGVLLTQEETLPQPELELLTVDAELINYRTAIVHKIRNSAPRLIKGAEVDIEVFPEGKEIPIWHDNRTDVAIAPCSKMDFTTYLYNENLVPGTYFSRILITWEDKVWEFSNSFIIDKQQAEHINYNSLSMDEPINQTGFNQWIIILLIFIGVLLIIIALIVYTTNKEY